MIRRLLICTQTFPPKFGGMEAVMYALASSFAEAGIETLVACDKPYFGDSKFSVKSFNIPKLVRARFKRTYLNLHGFDPDITICDSWKSVSALPRSRGKLIVLAHGQELLDSPRKHGQIKQALSQANLIIASSKMTAELVNHFKLASPIEVIYPTYMLTNIPTSLHHSQSTVRLISICRIEKRKGLLQSALALRDLKNSGYDFSWSIAGTGPELGELRNFVAACALSDCTEFLGRVTETEKARLLSAGGVFLMPSYQEGKSLEGFGISYIEAASYGLPAIAGNVGGAPEAVLDQVTGWCVDGSDPDAIRPALLEAISDHSVCEKYSVAARKRFEQELSGYRAQAKILELAQSLIQ